jgi:hypothetical protein
VVKQVVDQAEANVQAKSLTDVVTSLDDAEKSYYAGYVVTDLVYFEAHVLQLVIELA